MSAGAEVLVFSCEEDDVQALRAALGTRRLALRILDSPVAVAHHVVTRQPAAVFLGVGSSTLCHLDLIPVIHAARSDVPVIVIGRNDSLDLERRARQASIFYYLLHPIERPEVEAVLADALRTVRR